MKLYSIEAIDGVTGADELISVTSNKEKLAIAIIDYINNTGHDIQVRNIDIPILSAFVLNEGRIDLDIDYEYFYDGDWIKTDKGFVIKVWEDI